MDYKEMTLVELRELAREKGIGSITRYKKAELIDVLEKVAPTSLPKEENNNRNSDYLKELDSGIVGEGILEVLTEGYGFMRVENYLPGTKDIYVSPSQIRLFNIRTGDKLVGRLRKPKENEKFPAMLFLTHVNGEPTQSVAKRPNFEDLTPIFPTERLKLETSKNELSTRIIDIMAPLWPYAGPGHWNDADMLQVGNGDLTYDENVMHFSMWCMLASPLIVGCDLRNIDKKILDILTNKEAIAINQDKLGKQGRMFERSGRYHETWIKELSDGRIALCFLNKDEKEWSLDYHFWGFDIIGIDRTYDHYIVRDVWKHQDIGDTGDRYSFKVPAHGVVLLCLVPKQ